MAALLRDQKPPVLLDQTEDFGNFHRQRIPQRKCRDRDSRASCWPAHAFWQTWADVCRSRPSYAVTTGTLTALRPGGARPGPHGTREAEFGSKNGWERANYFRPAGAPRPPDTLGRPGWLDWVIEEQRATREAVAARGATGGPWATGLHMTRGCCAGGVTGAPRHRITPTPRAH